MRHDIKLVMTLLVRDEEDIIADNICFHANQGVDAFIVMDNLSRDRTPDILQDLSRSHQIVCLTQDADDYSQGEWVTAMARRACTELGADWVINNDADEFWVASSGSLKEYFAAVPQDVSAVVVERHNAPPSHPGTEPERAVAHPSTSWIFEKQSLNSLGRPLPPKCAHRGSSTVQVKQGNHDIEDLAVNRIAAGPGLYILHYPYRSLAGFRKKIEAGGAAYARNTTLDKRIGSTWRGLYQNRSDGAIEQFWKDNSRLDRDLYIGLIEGRYHIDRTVYDFCSRLHRERQDAETAPLVADCLRESRRVCDLFLVKEAEPIARVAPELRNERPLYHNLEFCMNGALAQLEALDEFSTGSHDLARQFSRLRDIYSLFPRNEAVRQLIEALLRVENPLACRQLEADILGKTVILHLSCVKYMSRAQASVASFPPSDRFAHLVVVGGSAAPGEAASLSFDYADGVLRVPVPDDYEHLHQKMFHALFVLSTLQAGMVVKVDDSLHCADFGLFSETVDRFQQENHAAAGRVVGSRTHELQWHGWHLGKCQNPDIEQRGYQFPLPREYPAGGYGYILSRQGLEACSYAYLAMRAFFEMAAIGLEDAYVGHALYAADLAPHSVASEEHLRAFPGLRTVED